MDLEVRRDVVHRRITGTCREGFTDAMARILDRPPPAPPSSRAFLRHSDRQTPPPRRFAARRDVVHRRSTGACREGFTDAMARCLDRPTACRHHPVRFVLRPDGQTSTPRRFAARRDVVHRRSTDTCPADLPDAMARCLDRSPARRHHPVRFFLRPDGETPSPRRFAARPDVIRRRITDACPADLTGAVGTKDCIARGYERRGFVEVDTGDKLSWTVQLTERPKVGIGGE